MTAEDLTVYLQADRTTIDRELNALFVSSKVECAPHSGPLYRVIAQEAQV